MKISEFEQKYNVILTLKKKSWPMRFVGFFLGSNFMEHFWTTFRLPFQKRATIAFPDSNNLSKYEEIPEWAMGVLDHELIHVEQFRPWYGPISVVLLVTIFPLPVFFSGRWYIEFPAYLEDIRKGSLTINQAAEILHSSYFYPWPKLLMKRKFYKYLKE